MHIESGNNDSSAFGSNKIKLDNNKLNSNTNVNKCSNKCCNKYCDVLHELRFCFCVLALGNNIIIFV